jgi:hypothetical protein
MALLLVPLVSVVVVFPTIEPVSAWGLTTHQFIASEASSEVTNASWATAFQYYSPEVLAGSTTPDQAWQDWDNHLYYPETEEYTAPHAAQRWYDFARANFTSESWEDGFFALGVASHYLVDPAICVHTDQAGSPEAPTFYEGHVAYEGDINAQLGSLVLDTPREFEIMNISQRVVDHAVFSHQFLEYILDAYQNEDDVAIETNATIKALTEDCLSMALNSTLSMFYTATLGLNAPDVTITYDKVALVDYAHLNDYIDMGGQNRLLSINQTLAREGYQMVAHGSEITTAALTGVDLFIATCAFNAYTTDELTAISTWAASGNKTILLTGRGDYSEYVNPDRPNQILNAVGSHIRVNHDNVYMLGTFAEYYNDLDYIPPLPDTAGLMDNIDTLTFYSPASLYFTDDGPVLPIVYANVTAWQLSHQSPDPTVIYDDTSDGVNGEQIPLIAVEEVETLRVFVAGTTFFSDYDYGRTATYDNIELFENFLEWAENHTIGSISDVDEIRPRIGDVTFTPELPENEQDVTFTATVTDPGGVNSVQLQYEGDSGTVTVDMTASGDVYTGVITGLSDSTILVKIVATDTDGNNATRAYYTVTWGGGGTTPPPTPIDPTLFLMIGGVGIVVVVIIIVIMKRR